MDSLAAATVLARVPGLSPAHVEQLLVAAEGDRTRLLDREVTSRVELPEEVRGRLAAQRPARLHADLKWLEKSGARVLLCVDPEYPATLRNIKDAPAVLYVLGQSVALNSTQVAIVGARRPTPLGLQTACTFATAMAHAGVTVTSGLAFGIDAASHVGALDAGGPTVAVLGTGLDRIYPSQHRPLAQLICSSGALVSEFPPGTALRPWNFPRRNRLISALAAGTLVVEAALKSGSLLTAGHARAQGRPVFAVPGRIHEVSSAGCHKLIREGAMLCAEPAEVLARLNIPFNKQLLATPARTRRKCPVLDKQYEMLLDALGLEPATIDALAARTHLTGASIASMLLILELQGQIAPYPGSRYGRIPR